MPRELILLLIVLIAAPASSFAASSMTVGGLATPPKGFIDFCRRHPGDCRQTTEAPHVVRLTGERSAELEGVHRSVNHRVFYSEDSANYGRLEHWAYPYLFGDCEDYALEKRRRLISLGWPHSALLLTAAKMPDGSRHLVLVAVTDHGEMVLDNYIDGVVHWKSVNYEWLVRQSPFDEARWLRLIRGGV
jgi:predicted transglutaminase-like cysteine proteinase